MLFSQMHQFGLKFYAMIFFTCHLNIPYPNQKQIAEKNKILKDKVYILITEFHSTQKDQYHRPQKETHI